MNHAIGNYTKDRRCTIHSSHNCSFVLCCPACNHCYLILSPWTSTVAWALWYIHLHPPLPDCVNLFKHYKTKRAPTTVHLSPQYSCTAGVVTLQIVDDNVTQNMGELTNQHWNAWKYRIYNPPRNPSRMPPLLCPRMTFYQITLPSWNPPTSALISVLSVSTKSLGKFTGIKRASSPFRPAALYGATVRYSTDPSTAWFYKLALREIQLHFLCICPRFDTRWHYQTVEGRPRNGKANRERTGPGCHLPFLRSQGPFCNSSITFEWQGSKTSDNNTYTYLLNLGRCCTRDGQLCIEFVRMLRGNESGAHAIFCRLSESEFYFALFINDRKTS